MQKKHILIIGGVTALFGACVIREEPLPPPQPDLTPAAAPNVPPASAIESIANARCDLALRCNRIGPYSEFMTRDHCLNLMRTRGQQEIRDCPQGVDQRALELHRRGFPCEQFQIFQRRRHAWHCQCAVQPPSMGNDAPVIDAAACVHR